MEKTAAPQFPLSVTSNVIQVTECYLVKKNMLHNGGARVFMSYIE